jgi:para-aminobenzoate synthetase component 1
LPPGAPDAYHAPVPFGRMGCPLPDHTPAFSPTRAAYVRLGAPAPVGARVPLAGRHPHDLLRRLAPGSGAFLLESAGAPDGPGRWSFLGGDPRFTLTATPAGVVVSEPGRAPTRMAGGPLFAIRSLLAGWATPRPAAPDFPPDFPPFFGGFVGLFTYDLARRFERLPERAVDDLHLPEADLDFVDTVVAVDHREQRLWVTWVPGPRDRSDLDPGRLYDRGRARVEAVLARLAEPAPAAPAARPVPDAVRFTPGMERERFLDIVRRAKDYIAAGDIFQANLSQRFTAPLSGTDPWDLYVRLTAINPSPFAAYLDRGGYRVVSSSPERLVTLRGDRVGARPIAGTRPRGNGRAGDAAQRREMLASPKERAEHVMLVDLMRNDLGRVCDYGSVRVSEFMTTERYSHVMHIVSNVVGRLGPGMDAASVLRAVFPGGTITGAPKVRCMEIIEELEPVRRGVYTGSAGYLSAAGDMDLNILIRTILVRGDTAYVQAGAGIVADSDPAFEHAETLHKAEAMRRALGATGTARPKTTVAAAGG